MPDIVQCAILRTAIGSPCPYCGEPMQFPTRDHIRPRSKGGSNADLRNRAIVCEPCNVKKGARSLAGFLAVLIETGDVKRAACVAAFMAWRELPPALPPDQQKQDRISRDDARAGASKMPIEKAQTG